MTTPHFYPNTIKQGISFVNTSRPPGNFRPLFSRWVERGHVQRGNFLPFYVDTPEQITHVYLTFPDFSSIFPYGLWFFLFSSYWGSLVRKLCLFLFFFLVIALSVVQTALAAPRESQEIWRVDLHAVTRLSASEQHFSKLSYYRWQKNRWQISDAETFFGTQQPEIPLIVFAPGYTSTIPQTTQVGLGVVRTFDPDQSYRIVFWSWYSERGIGNIRRDVRNKLPIIDNTADYLALFLQKLEPQSKVCLFGFSFGCRVVCNTVSALQEKDHWPEGLRLNLVLAGAATDRDWFAKGQRHSRVPEIVEKILVTYNPDDWALRFYPLMYEFSCRAKALGLEGLPMQNIAPEFRDKFENINVYRYIGDEHKTLVHVRTPAFQSRVGAYFFFE